MMRSIKAPSVTHLLTFSTLAVICVVSARDVFQSARSSYHFTSGTSGRRDINFNNNDRSTDLKFMESISREEYVDSQLETSNEKFASESEVNSVQWHFQVRRKRSPVEIDLLESTTGRTVETPNVESDIIKDAALLSRQKAIDAAYNETNYKKAVAMADGDKGSPIANAISKTGQDAIATATNRSEANALAGTDGGSGNALASSQTFGQESAKTVALNAGNGTATSSSIALGKGTDAKSDAIAQRNNASSSSLGEKGSDAVSNALTHKEGHADSNAAATEGGLAKASALSLGKGDSKAGSVAEGGGNATSQSMAKGGNATSDSQAKDGGAAHSIAFSEGDGNSKANSVSVGQGETRAEAKNEGSGSSVANAIQQNEDGENTKIDINKALEVFDPNSSKSGFSDPFFNFFTKDKKTRRKRHSLGGILYTSQWYNTEVST